MRSAVACCSLIAVALTLAPGQVEADDGKDANDFAAYEWTKVYDGNDAGWIGRAGLQAVELRNRLYLMGGRTPDPMPFNPFGSILWDDVWVSRDLGATWKLVAAGPVADRVAPDRIWTARGYFKALTKGGAMFVLGRQDFSVGPPAIPGRALTRAPRAGSDPRSPGGL